MNYDIVRDMVTLARADFDTLVEERSQLRLQLEAARSLALHNEQADGQNLQAMKLSTIERERYEQRVSEVVTFCLELLATVAAKTTWTHTQRNSFDLLLIAELEKLVLEDVNDIPF